jgi:hypothetical protein
MGLLIATGSFAKKERLSTKESLFQLLFQPFRSAVRNHPQRCPAKQQEFGVIGCAYTMRYALSI